MKPRAVISKTVETEVLTRCRRRCCLCFGLDGDNQQKDGQIAHLDRNRTNPSADNLAFLCFKHHNQYDSQMSQSKGLTIDEVKGYRSALWQAIDQGILGVDLRDTGTPAPQRGRAAHIDALVADKTEGFVGREYVFDAIESFISSTPSGYFHLRGEPGQGKTSILAEFVRRTSCPAHFVARAEGRTTIDAFLASLHEQLAEPDTPELPLTLAASARDLVDLFQASVTKLPADKRLTVVVDALDEVDASARAPGENTLLLPAHIPNRVHLLVSSRTGTAATLHAANLCVLDLADYRDRALVDIQNVVIRSSTRPGISAWLARQNVPVENLAAELASKSEGNFMYVHYVLSDIADGGWTDRAIGQLPVGLQNYYAMHWERMGMHHISNTADRLTLLSILSQLRMPVSARFLGQIAGIEPLRAQSILTEWAQFLRRHEGADEARFSIYHTSFADFLQRVDAVRVGGLSLAEIHRRIAGHLLHDLRVGNTA